MSDSNDIEVSVSGLRRTYIEGQREHVVLDGVDLDVSRGESVAIRGRSGSGKSTLLNLVGGIDVPDAGRIVVAGTELTTLSERDRTLFRRRNVGFVYQAFNLVPTLDVADNIRLVLELNDVSGDEANRRIGQLLEAIGLEDRAGSFPDLLSGGEQQRVAIARALSHRPAILIHPVAVRLTHRLRHRRERQRQQRHKDQRVSHPSGSFTAVPMSLTSGTPASRNSASISS